MKYPKLDILAFAAHPDDIEISMGGTLLKHIKMGYKIGIIDLTRGELGTRGNASIREKEAQNASKKLGIDIRVNLNMPDGFLSNTKENIYSIIEVIRRYCPKIVFCNAISDRHPDHAKAHTLVKEACFLSGLPKVVLYDTELKAHRPDAVYAYIQDEFRVPDFVIDVTDFWENRMEVLMCYESQFYNPQSNEPNTPISSASFLQNIEGRGVQMGRYIGCNYGEGFNAVRPMGIDDVVKII